MLARMSFSLIQFQDTFPEFNSQPSGKGKLKLSWPWPSPEATHFSWVACLKSTIAHCQHKVCLRCKPDTPFVLWNNQLKKTYCRYCQWIWVFHLVATLRLLQLENGFSVSENMLWLLFQSKDRIWFFSFRLWEQIGIDVVSSGSAYDILCDLCATFVDLNVTPKKERIYLVKHR